MTFDPAIADRSRRRQRRSGTVALTSAAVALALGAAAWISYSDQTTASLASAALPKSQARLSFDERFSPLSSSSSPEQPAADASVLAKIRRAKSMLAQQLLFGDWRNALADQASRDFGRIDELKTGEIRLSDLRLDEPRVTDIKISPGGIPLPRSRPATADLEARPGPVMAAASSAEQRSEDRSLLQKLSDLMPRRVKLASLGSDGGIFQQVPDLQALGYDAQTAVYDITAHAVYLPSGVAMEAHSGMGSLRDDPDHVTIPMTGATPPAIYELKPRERLFHGVAALRMTPVENTSTNGRSGLLVHSYMLGPDGDSNGCVSIRNYDKFLKAFNDGEINRLVVVPSLNTETQVAQRSNAPS
jgi:Protein of unknown function (DUF2778)